MSSKQSTVWIGRLLALLLVGSLIFWLGILLTGCGLKPWATIPPGRYQVAKVVQEGPTAKVWLAGVRKPIYLPTDTLAPGKYITLATASNKR